MRVLILGGTTEASELAHLLVREKRFVPTLSLAGRTAKPALAPIPYRTGGFGGANGLVAWLTAARIEAIVDATHPFAIHISRNAKVAASILGVPLLSILRPPWEAKSGDRWTQVDTIEAAVSALNPRPLRVFLTVGRLELAAFRAAPQHTYVIRTIDPPDKAILTPRTKLLFARGPFEEQDELRLLRENAIELLVTKNSGGRATYGKIAAARTLGLPVILVVRPPMQAGERVPDARSALEWLQRRILAH